MKKFISIIGNRPNLLKVDPEFKQKIIYTGQHYDELMSDIFVKELGITIDYNLQETTLGGMIEKIIPILEEEKPHYVIVYGDTRSSVAGALAAQQCGINIIHVEAGCRSGNSNQIEERNRILIDKISTVHLVPSFSALESLRAENIAENVYVVGCANFSNLIKTFPTKRMVESKYALLTIHRAENTDDKTKLESIFRALKEYPYEIIFPIHPRTKKFIADNEIVIPSNIHVVNPMGYKEFASYIGFAEHVITDSGGVQAESYFMRTPCITLREETEWKETVNEGWNILVGTDEEKLRDAIQNFRVRKTHHNSAAYGLGKSHKIIKTYLASL